MTPDVDNALKEITVDPQDRDAGEGGRARRPSKLPEPAQPLVIGIRQLRRHDQRWVVNR